MRKIKLLTISATCERGGSDINLLRLLRSLDKNEYDILHLVPYPGSLMDEFSNAGVRLMAVDMPRMRLFKNPLKYITVLLKFFPTVFKIKKIIVCNQIDLICTSSMVNLYGALAAKLTHRPHILIAVEYLPVLSPFTHYFLLLSDKIICCSDMVSRMFKKSGKVLVKYPGVDLNEFSPHVDSRAVKEELGISGNLVSMVTRLDKWKGVETFIRAAKYVEHEAKFIIFAELVLGKEKYLNKLENMIKQLRLDGRVFIRITRCTPEVIAASDIIVHASLRPEPFGLIVIESMATGKPVIASKLGGPLEIISDGADGLLVESANPQILALAISGLLKNPKVASEMGVKAREKVTEKFNIKEYARSFDGIFKEALKEHSLKQARISIGKSRLVRISAPLAKLLAPGPCKQKDVDKDAIEKILVIQLFGMGDLICSFALLETFKQYFGQSRITLLVDKKLTGLAKFMGYSDYIGYKRGILSKLRLLPKIRKDKFDLAVVLNPLFQGAWIAYLSQAKYRLGYVRDYEGIQNIEKISCLLTHPVLQPGKPMHDIYRYLGIIEPIGINPLCPVPELNIPESMIVWADKFLQDNGIKQNEFILGINPHAGWESKCWPIDNFVKVADNIAEEHNAKIIFFGSPARKDIERVDVIMRAMRHKAISAAGETDMPKLAALINKCSVFLTNDSGPMHLAAALSINIVALFGASDVRKFGYEKENIINIVANDLFCKPYALNDGVCMKGIEAKEVIKAIEILRRNKK